MTRARPAELEGAAPASAAGAAPGATSSTPALAAADPAAVSGAGLVAAPPRTSRRRWLLALAASPVLGGAVALGEHGAHNGLPRLGASWRGWSWLGGALTPRERIQKFGLPNVELLTHTGRTVRFYDDLIKDRKVVINFIYATCNGICVPVTSRLVQVQRALDGRVGRDIFFYSISLKPVEDTPEVLRRYAEAHHVGPGWLFLTGKPEHIETLRQALGFIDLDPVKDADTTNHVGMVRYGVEREMRWGSCPGLARPEHILRSILWDLDSPVTRKES